MTPNPSLEPTHTGMALGPLPGSIIRPAGQAPFRRGRLSSNVRRTGSKRDQLRFRDPPNPMFIPSPPASPGFLRQTTGTRACLSTPTASELHQRAPITAWSPPGVAPRSTVRRKMPLHRVAGASCLPHGSSLSKVYRVSPAGGQSGRSRATGWANASTATLNKSTQVAPFSRFMRWSHFAPVNRRRTGIQPLFCITQSAESTGAP